MPGVAAAAATFSVTAIKPNPADPFSGCIQGTLLCAINETLVVGKICAVYGSVCRFQQTDLQTLLIYDDM